MEAVDHRGLARPSCLRKAVALAWVLSGRGIAATVKIGVAKADGELRAHAWLEGRAEVTLEDLSPLAHGTWTTPEQRRQAASLVLTVALPTLATCLEELDRALEQHRALLAAKTDEDAVRASIALRKIATKIKALAKGVGHPRVVEVARRVEGLQADAIKRVAGAGVS